MSQRTGERATNRMGLPPVALQSSAMVAPPGALRWATRRASFVVPDGFGAVAFEFLRWVAFAAGDSDCFLNGLLVMVFSSDIAAQVDAATGASPG